jgi:hypothetical protein
MYEEILEQKPRFEMEYFRMIPIKQVLNAEGIEVVNGKFCCPGHNDSHPSAVLMKTKLNDIKAHVDDYYGWHCFVCGSGGDAISLIQTIHNYNFKEACVALWKMGLVPNEAIKFKDKNEVNKEDDFPEIPVSLIRAIGLKNNPIYGGHVNIEGKSVTKITLPPADAAELILQKLIEYKHSIISYGKDVCRDFDGLNTDAIESIVKTTKERARQIDYYISSFRDYTQKQAIKNEIDYEKELSEWEKE